VLVLLKLGLTENAGAVPLAKLGADIGISASEFHGALNRTAAAGLLDLDLRRPRLSPFLEFLEHGLRYVFISRRGEITRGIPTAHSIPLLSDALMQGAVATAKPEQQSQRGQYPSIREMFAQPDRYPSIREMFAERDRYPSTREMFAESAPLVWPHPEGQVRGESLEPLYPSAVDAALKDTKLYECLALVDALRVGRARERKLAIDFLTQSLGRT